MKTFHVLFIGICLALSCHGSDKPAEGPSGAEAFRLIHEGNVRFVQGTMIHPNITAQRRLSTAKDGQKPMATILACSDSREPIELIFDQGIGSLFIVRVAGNVANEDEIGSIEYGAGHLHTPLIIVLGHSSCGAVTAAVKNAEVSGSIPRLINSIKPAVQKASQTPQKDVEALVNASIRENVFLSMENIFTKSSEVRELVHAGVLSVIGGIYHLDTGTVEWLGIHPQQALFLKAHAQTQTPGPGGHGIPTAPTPPTPATAIHGK